MEEEPSDLVRLVADLRPEDAALLAALAERSRHTRVTVLSQSLHLMEQFLAVSESGGAVVLVHHDGTRQKLVAG